jgi:DNA (cytosine-5)-methyltransferase 1
MLDLFSGIGEFHKGFEQAGYEFDWVGFSEIDKYASAVYRHRFPEAVELGDITTIQPGRDLPDHIDIICGGFPCQSFSMAGKRKGFDDTRGTLFFEIARLLRHYRETESPIDYFLLENVKGLLSHDNGRTFATIYGVLSDLGYTVEFQLLNTRWWLPQNRERIYLVGYIGDRSGPKVFPIGEDGGFINESGWKNHRKATSKQNGYSRTISSRIHKMGCEDTYIIDKKGNKKNNQHYAANLTGGEHSGGNHSDMDLIKIPEATKKGYAEAEEGDSINLSVPNNKTRRGRVGKGEAQTLDTGMQQYTIQKEYAPCIRAEHHNTADVHYVKDIPKYGQKALNETLEKENLKEDGETLTGQDQHGVMIEKIGNIYKSGGENGNVYHSDGISPSLKSGTTSNPKHGGIGSSNAPKIANNHSIRRLTPVECCRLQGFPDDWNEYGEFDGEVKPMSDTQRYKQAGNAVTVNVVQSVAERIASPKVQLTKKG